MEHGVYQVLVADLILSFDNTLAGVAASKGNFNIMVIGLLLSVFLIATLASYFAEYIRKHQWLGYIGLIAILNYCNPINHRWFLLITLKYFQLMKIPIFFSI